MGPTVVHLGDYYTPNACPPTDSATTETGPQGGADASVAAQTLLRNRSVTQPSQRPRMSLSEFTLGADEKIHLVDPATSGCCPVSMRPRGR